MSGYQQAGMKSSDSACIPEIVTVEFADSLYQDIREREESMMPGFLGLSNWKDRISINYDN